MITLDYPMDTRAGYIIWCDAIVGPFSPIDGQPFGFNSIEERSSCDYLNESKSGWVKENFCDHRETTAHLVYEPWTTSFVISPTINYPDRLNLKLSPTNSNYAIAGRANHGHVTKYTYDGSTTVDQRAYNRENSIITCYKVTNSAYNPSNAMAIWVYSCNAITKNSDGTVRLTFKYDYYCALNPAGIVDGNDWKVKQSLETIMSLIDMMPKAVPTAEYIVDKTLLCPSLSSYYTPSQAFEAVEMLIRKTAYPSEFPGDVAPFGDLAMRASDQANANHVNMLEFCKDLRNPLELVPQLHNFRSMLGLSSEYLRLNFGILPTISDLKDIVDAFKKVSSLDVKGNSLYYASDTQTETMEFYETSIVRHLKLAVAREDNGLEALISGLESFGVLPTFENLWDLVPYSFLIDWFVNVGDFLARIDSRQRLARFNIAYVTMSQKFVVKGHLPFIQGGVFSGPISTVYYHRWVSDQCPEPPLSLKSSLLAFSHWLEAGALLIQRRK